MPIYEYECQACGHVLDALQKVSDDPLTHCPTCGKEALKKLISAPRFRLKGSGWYETDFKDKNRRNIASGDSGGSDTSTSASSSDKSGAKTANAKADSKPTSSGTAGGGSKSSGGKSDASSS